MDVIIFIVALSVLVLVHEFGHYIMAVWNGIKVEEFGLGLPPRLISKKIGETVFSLNALPIGGFCKLYGEDPAGGGEIGNLKRETGGNKLETRSFMNKKPWQKFLVVIGGVLMNIILAIAIFTTVYGVLGIPEERDEVKITDIAPGSPAEKAGLKVGDIVMKVENTEVKKADKLMEEVGKYKGRNVKLLISNDKTEIPKEIIIEVRENPPEGQGSMGVAISHTELVKPKWYELYKGIGAGFKEAFYWAKVIGQGVFGMIASLLGGKVPSDVAGPLGMFQATSSIKQNQGMWALVHFFGIISVNLAVVNILPFPALDGGRIIFVVYEWITKRRANEKFEMMVNNIGMMVLLSLIILVTVGDVMRLIRN